MCWITMAEQITTALKRSPLPRHRIAALVGVSPNTLWRWATGATTPNAKHLAPLAAVLGLDLVEMLTAKQSPD
jgi:transcriptional regulator with XRE-family HTH domain